MSFFKSTIQSNIITCYPSGSYIAYIDASMKFSVIPVTSPYSNQPDNCMSLG